MRPSVKLFFVLIAIALLLCLAWRLIAAAGMVLQNVDLRSSEPDPMFREEAQLPTRPPEMDLEIPQAEHPTLDDYVPEIETPVDQTAEALIRAAQEAEHT